MRLKALIPALASPLPILLAVSGKTAMEAALPASLLLLAVSYAIDGWAEETPEAARAARLYAALAVGYSAAALAYTRSTLVIATASLATAYSLIGLIAGSSAATPALFLTVAVLGALAAPTAPPPLLPILALSVIAAPATYSLWSIYCAVRRRSGEPCNMPAGKYLAATLFFTGVAAAMAEAVVYVSPFYAPMLALMAVAAVASLRATVLAARGSLWSYSSYTGFDEALVDKLLEMLGKTGWRYAVKGVWGRRGVKVAVEEPFRASIVVREWRHRYYMYHVAPGASFSVEPGVIVEVRPGPEKAPPPLREFIASYLEEAGLPDAAYEWRQINSAEE